MVCENGGSPARDGDLGDARGGVLDVEAQRRAELLAVEEPTHGVDPIALQDAQVRLPSQSNKDTRGVSYCLRLMRQDSEKRLPSVDLQIHQV